MQVRDFFVMRTHGGRRHVLLSKVGARLGRRLPWLARAIDRAVDRLDADTQRRSREFDLRYGTETYLRLDVRVTDEPRADAVWGYGAVNHDFFREIFRAVPTALAPYAFVDVGSGKGAAVLMASEFPFRRLIGLELTPELIDIARRNVQQFNSKTGAQLAPLWVHCDFFKWPLPDEPLLFFFNNPFPDQITLEALDHLERVVSAHRHPVLLVFRKAPKVAGDHLHRSTVWRPLRLAPYWRVYAAGPAAATST
jgi:predicted RNA methylase